LPVVANATDRADAGASTEPPCTSVDQARLSVAGGVFIEGTNKWLTFELSGGEAVRLSEGLGRPC
jgi:hypothetical protein